MKNIVYISTSRIPSETANSVHVMKMCNALSTKCESVHLVCVKGEDVEHDVFRFYNVNSTFKIHYLSENTFKYLIELSKLLKKINPTVTYGRFLYGCLLASLMKFQTLFEVHSMGFVGTFKSRIAFWLLAKNRNFLKIISITNALKSDMVDEYDFKDNKIIVLPDAADEVPVEREECSLINYKDKFNVGYVGSMHPGKGVELVLKLAESLPQFNFHIVGGKVEDVSMLKAKYDYKNLSFYGFVSQTDLKKYISFFDTCLLPNQENIFLDGVAKSNIGKYTSPLKMFEYMSYYKPIISSDLDVIREVLNEQNSLLVHPSDIDDWKKAIIKLSEDKELSNKIAKQAYEDFISNYTWDKRAEKILESFND